MPIKVIFSEIRPINTARQLELRKEIEDVCPSFNTDTLEAFAELSPEGTETVVFSDRVNPLLAREAAERWVNRFRYKDIP